MVDVEPLGAHAYQHENLKFVVNQSVWWEGETPFADVILPACTVFERWDIGEWYNVGAGYVHHMYSMNNHRVISLQHKCIEPLGESKSDYDIFLADLRRSSAWARSTPRAAPPSYDWCKRVFDSSDMAKHISWREFLKKGYFVVPPTPSRRARRRPTAGSTRAARRTRPSPTRCRPTTSAASARACRRRRASSSSSRAR
jgi:anaerobic selenocysteine-containing dehydrogenase